MNLKCDLDLEDSKATFFHQTLAHDDASQYINFGDKEISDSEDLIQTNIH